MQRRKRDRISGTAAAYEERLREARRDLAHINAARQLFEASGDPAEFPPCVTLNRMFRRGETTALCMSFAASCSFARTSRSLCERTSAVRY